MDSLKNLTETFVVEIKTSYVGGPPPPILVSLGLFSQARCVLLERPCLVAACQ